MPPEKKTALTAALRKKWPLLALALCGILLLLFAGSGGESATPSAQSPYSDAEGYRATLEAELSELLSHVSGVGRLKLLITLKGSATAHYATESKGEGREEYVTVGGACVLLSTDCPQVLGVAVVCDGGNDPTVCAELTALLCAALGVGSNRVSIAPYA